jgi:hypothetical protein
VVDLGVLLIIYTIDSGIYQSKFIAKIKETRVSPDVSPTTKSIIKRISMYINAR